MIGRRIIATVAFLILGAVLTHAQNRYTVRGMVLSAVDSSGLGYVNISYANGLKGSVSNEEGAFSVSIATKNQIDSLVFSHLGFKNKRIPVASTISDISLKVYMTPYEHALPDITVRAIDAEKLVIESLSNISKEYHTKDHILEGFYREAVTYRARDEALYFAEGTLKTYKKGYENNPSRKYQNRWYDSDSHVVIDSGYVVEDKSSFKYRSISYPVTDIVGGPTAPLAVDLYKESAFLLNKEHLEQYKFEYEGYESKGGEDYYIISFKPKASHTRIYQGTLYYNVERGIITRAEYSYNPVGISIYNQQSELKLLQRNFTVSYALFNGRYTLAFVKVENRFFHPILGHLFDNSIEYSTSSIVTGKVKKFKRKQRFGRNSNLRDGLLKRGLKSWTDVTHIPRLESVDNRLSRIPQVENQLSVVHDGKLQTFPYDKSLKYSKSNRKPTLLIFSAHWCLPCKKLQANIRSSSEMIQFLNNGFNLTYIDVETLIGKRLSRKHNVYSLPSTLILNEDEVIFEKTEGYHGLDSYREFLANGLEKLKRIRQAQELTTESEELVEDPADLIVVKSDHLDRSSFLDSIIFQRLPHSSKFEFVSKNPFNFNPPHLLEYFMSRKHDYVAEYGLFAFYDRLIQTAITSVRSRKLVTPELFEIAAETYLGDEMHAVSWLYTCDYFRFAKEDYEMSAKAGLNFLVSQQYADLNEFDDLIVYVAQNLEEQHDLQLLFVLLRKQNDSPAMDDHKRYLTYRLTGKLPVDSLNSEEISVRSFYDILNRELRRVE